MGRSRGRVICKCSTCVANVGENGCSFSASGHNRHLELLKRRAAENDARIYYDGDSTSQSSSSDTDDGDDPEPPQAHAVNNLDTQITATAANAEDDDSDISDDDIPIEVLEEILDDEVNDTDDDEPGGVQEEANSEGGQSDSNNNSRQQHSDPFVPRNPTAFILFILVVLFYGRYVSDHALEIMMQCFNIVMDFLDIPYRFPRRVEQLKQWIQRQGDTEDGIKEYVMCQKCASIYPYETQPEKTRLHRHSKCKFKDTLNQSHKCMTALFEKVTMQEQASNNGNAQAVNSTSSETIQATASSTLNKYVPLKRLYYNSLIYTLRLFMRRDGFAQMLREAFKRNDNLDRQTSNGSFMSDVQHGDTYQTFCLDDDETQVPFTKQSPFNLMLLLNLDWLSPFDMSSYSVGGVWLSILNLDHSERLLRSNTILSSILPGPKEATQIELARLLKPLVDELKELQNGVLMMDSTGNDMLVRACLCLVSADLPAIRKVMGVGAHNALYSCGFCDHEFESCDSNQRNYSNLDIDTFPRRTKATQAANSLKWQRAKTQTERDEIKKATGTAYTVFQELSYFDCIEFQAVDVLHCAYLGIAKRIIRTIWLDIGCTVPENVKILSTADLKGMAQLLDGFVFPLDLDGQSLRRKLLIGDGFGYFKGSEYAVFLLVSPYMLQGKLPSSKYNNFMKFVEINRILRSPGIYREDIATVKTLTNEFMQEFAILYNDPKYLSSNFHVFLHLPETMYRYSTPTNFWLFFYERLNADIKSINTNNNSNNNIEKTFFTRFLNGIYSKELYKKIPKPIDLPNDVSEKLETLLTAPETKEKMPVSSMLPEYLESKQEFSIFDYLEKESQRHVEDQAEEGPDYSVDDQHDSAMFVGLEILPPTTIASIQINFDKSAILMDYRHFSFLVDYYNATYSSNDSAETLHKYVGGQHGAISNFEGQVIPVSNLIRKFKGVKLFTSIYKSMEGTSSKLKRGSFVLAYCRNDPNAGSPISCLRAGQIVYFFRHSVSVQDEMSGELFGDQTHTFAFMRWFKRETQHFSVFSRHHMGYCRNEFEPDSLMNIVPVLRIYAPIAIKINHFDNLNVYIKMPRSVF